MNKALRYQSEGLVIDPQWWTGVDSASKNEYQENSWGVKTAGA
jgi:hypothetical protein